MESLSSTLEFKEIYSHIQSLITKHGFSVVEENTDKPWGAYIRLDNDDAEKFAEFYFPGKEFTSFKNLSPKFLIVAPGKRLSWQKHARRAELWTVLKGPVGVKLSDTDEEPMNVTILQEGEYVEFDTSVRHRLVGLEAWGIVTEIWNHTKAPELSDEADIIRIQDDFSR